MHGNYWHEWQPPMQTKVIGEKERIHQIKYTVGGYLFSMTIGTLLAHLSEETSIPLFSVRSLARAWLIQRFRGDKA